MVHARLLDRVAEVEPPVEVEDDLRHRPKDAGPSGSTDGQVDLALFIVHDEGRGGGQGALASSREVEWRR